MKLLVNILRLRISQGNSQGNTKTLLWQKKDKKDKRGQISDKPRTEKGLAKGHTDRKFNFTKIIN